MMQSEPTGPMLLGQVLAILPDTVYQDEVYDQDVVVEIGPGQQLLVFDYEMLVPPGCVGRQYIFELRAFLPDIEPCEDEYVVDGFVPEARNLEREGLDQEAWDHYIEHLRSRYGVSSIMSNRLVAGKVLELDGRDEFILDVGPGTISVYYDPSRQTVIAGQQVRLRDFRLDLKHIAQAVEGTTGRGN